ncbi:hypothetical protein HJO_12776 [Hyphomonas johnsonii MHS-2]|uniref:Uncharacterized protein n=2 Tax=Hyphomonas johnsonii TaxID=81031 RepID=A0A059FJ76_9PROT|nr:hypothetical protein HJO_12776 [Hyphomonas johnsonii MHS-2]
MVQESKDGLADLLLLLSRASDTERTIGLCLFAFIFMLLMLRPPKERNRTSSTGREFGFALIIIVVLGFGVGWMFDGTLSVPDMSTVRAWF